MLSFPSTLTESKYQYGGGNFSKYQKTFDTVSLRSININSSVPVIQELLKPKYIALGNYQKYVMYDNFNGSQSVYENPNMISYGSLVDMKDYDWIYKKPVRVPINDYDEKQGDNDVTHIIYMGLTVSPSMFNPMNGVNALGMTSNVPLLNGVDYNSIEKVGDMKIDHTRLLEKSNLSNCTISELCRISKEENSILGVATYKYADFMYCRDLGKISNNYLITLRRFAHPVGDHIFELTNKKYTEDEYSFKQEGDVGRLVTWFGNSENRLEDIVKFSFHSTWKELGSQVEQKDSVADDETGGIMNRLANTFGSSYTQSIVDATNKDNGSSTLWTWLGGKIGIADYMNQGAGKNNELLTMYDNNRVYTPKNTIQSTHMYEGKIEFTHEFTLTFNYKLRAYDNINPKSAFLDLIGNIAEVTGRRGQFWGGSRRLIGPEVNQSFFDQAEKIIDNKLDEIGGIWQSIQGGGLNFESIMGAIGDFAKEAWTTITEGAKGAIDTVNKVTGKKTEDSGEQKSEIRKNTSNLLTALAKNGAQAAGGYLKNALGRPKKIAWQSLLDGSNTGLWHVTIGNPKNPIIAMGNLIVTESTISQSGPLGLDDFPSDLKVTVTLKHARPRDITDITRMYTKGTAAIYAPLVNGEFYKGKNANKQQNNKLGDFLSSYGLDKTQTNDINNMARLTPNEQETSSNTKTKGVNNMPKGSIDEYNKEDFKTLNSTTYATRIKEMNNYSSIMALLSASEVA